MDQHPKSTPSEELRLDAVIAEYLQLQDRGYQVDKQAFIAQHLDLADELEAFFQDIPALDSDAGPSVVDMEVWEREDTSDTRYSVSSLHASGGIGRIYIAQDGDLRRKVALKSIHPRLHDHPIVQARFLREAQITGQLEHPNIVPVYELVRNDDGVVRFYTMKLVRGKTLRAEIRSYYADSEQGRIAFHRLVAAFLNVCYAVDYAHSREIIHRDLKPDNVMIGKFGEVALMDWGLAKHLATEESQESAVQLSAILPGDVSTPNFEPGTPAYMAPEQARAESHRVDCQTDVYGLGAILFELLTCEVPHVQQNGVSLRDQIAAQTSPDPLARRSDAPRALAEICRKAMAFDPRDRYSTAKHLGDDVERWLADEPVSVYREPIAKRATRWIRRHRVAASLFAGIAAAGTIAAAVWWKAEDSKDRLALAETSRLLGAAETAMAAGHLEEAMLGFSNAQVRSGSRPRLEHLASQAAERLEIVEGVLEERHDFAVFRDFVAETLTAAEVDTMLGDMKAAREHCQQILNRYDEGLWEHRLRDASLGPDAVVTCRQEILEANLLLVAAETSSDRSNTPEGLEKILALLNRGTAIYPESRALWMLKGEYLAALGRQDEAIAAHNKASESPSQSAFDFFVYGEIDRRNRQFPAAVQQYECALQLKPDDFWSHVRLASCWDHLGRPQFSLAHYDHALRLRPDASWLRAARAVAYADLQMWDDAFGDLAEAERLDPDFYGIHNNRGVIYVRQATGAPGTTSTEQRIALLRDAESEFHQCMQQRPSYAGAWNNLGRVYQELGELSSSQAETAESNSYYDQAGKAFSAALDSDPDSTTALINRSLVKSKLADFVGARSDVAQARQLDPQEPGISLALGQIDLAEGETQEAGESSESLYRSAAKNFGEAISLSPYDSAGYLGRARARFEIMQLDTRLHYPASTELAKSILADLEIAERHTGPAFPWRQRAALLGMRATARVQLGDYAQALADYAQSLELEPGDAFRRVRRGWSLALAPDQGMADFNAVLASREQTNDRLRADAHAGRAYLLALAGDDRSAVAEAERAIALASQDGPTLFNAACSYGLATGIARYEHQDETLSETYAVRAIELLRQSIANGMTDLTVLTEDRTLVALRQRADFAELIQRGAKSAPTPKSDLKGQ